MATHDQSEAARHFLSGCLQAGVRRLVLSPGSRSTPLAVAAHRLAGLDVSIHLDERSAAFAALGEAKASGSPVALACTSGTAAANYLPAISEANMASVPLVVITADRPPEHVGWGVGQSFDQLGLYHRQVRSQISMPVGADGGLDHALRAGYRATITATLEFGPVHVNWPFRLPVEPVPADAADIPSIASSFADPRAGRPDPSPLGSVLGVERAVIVAGPGASLECGGTEALVGLARARGWPILADALSGFRGIADAPIVDAADALCDSGFAPTTDLVIRVGDTPTAKSIRLWWEAFDCPHLVIDPRRRWQDPSHRVTHIHGGDPDPLIDLAGPDRTGDVDRWISGGAAARKAIDAVLSDTPRTEAHVVHDVVTTLDPARSVLVASSSMPVRDVDSFLRTHVPLEVIANRGINGIDGVASTAIGVARARPDRRPVILLGDIAALHDVGGILDCARQGIDCTIVIPNNGGGGIFSFLPIRDALPRPDFDTLFHTPHQSDLAFLDAHPGIDHRRLDDGDLADALVDAAGRPGVVILEEHVDIDARLSVRDLIADAVASSLAGR